MKLRPIETDDIAIASFWLSKKENYQWLDFGNGIQKIGAPTLKMMIQRNIHEIRLFTTEDSHKPIGIVALSDINVTFRSAAIWFVLGDKKSARKNYTTEAVNKMLQIGFERRNLNSVYAWTLENNRGGKKVIEQNHFRYIGRRRKCHFIDGKQYDRLLYDLLKFEFKNGIKNED